MDSPDDFQSTSMNPRAHRKVYLITYSQANRILYPTKESFGLDEVEAFNQGLSKMKVLPCTCCLESHQNEGDHYHLAVKLSGSKRWKCVTEFLMKKSGIVVNFSDSHHNYYTALKYISKRDTNIFLSLNHPNLQEMSSPKTSKYLSLLRRKRAHSSHSVSNRAEREGETGLSKIKHLSNYEVYEFITGNNIQSVDELFFIACTQEGNGKKDLANYLLSRSLKSISDLFDAAKQMGTATSTMKRAQISRMEILEEASEKECNCGREWFQCATQLMVSNGIHPFVFADRIRNLLISGRGKYRNIIITGLANCGKTFLLRQLEDIF